MTRIELMDSLDLTRNSAPLEQVFLIERDAGLLCRILGLYAARGVDVLRVDYAYAAQEVMKLRVSVAQRLDNTEEVVRVLLDKASTLIGVLAATEQPVAERRAS
jgi:acetolactate synthase small subunit